MAPDLLALDRFVFCVINAGWSRPWLDGVFVLLTYLGLGSTLALLGFVALFLFDRRRFPKNFLVLGLVVLIGGQLAQSAKSVAHRPRPLTDPALGADFQRAVKSRVLGAFDKRVVPLHPTDPRLAWDAALNVIDRPLKQRSFPSGHAQAAFGVATALLFVYRRRWMWSLYIVAAAIGLSRIYIGVHYPLDVLGGAAIGVANSLILLAWTRKYTGLGLPRPRGVMPSAHPAEEPLVMLVAGEASADTYAANLMHALRTLRPRAQFVGIGGRSAIDAGLATLGRAEELSIVGFTAVLAGLGRIRRLYLAALRAVKRQRPDVLVCLDLPDFNLALAAQARARGVPVLYYISPQIWAWRTGRIKTIADRVDHMVVALPFEQALYEKEGVPCTFAGHPILETIRPRFADRAAARTAFGLPLDKKVIVLAPGSRGNEIKCIAPVLADAARLLAARHDDLAFAVPLAPTVDEAWVRSFFEAQKVNVVFTRGDFFDLLACADAGAITSGTATLESALAGLPHVVCYRGNRLNFAIAKRVVRTDKIGLPNIVLGRVAFTELIQDDCHAEAVAAKVESLLAGEERAEALAACLEVRRRLHGGDVSRRVAEQVLALVDRRHGQGS